MLLYHNPVNQHMFQQHLQRLMKHLMHQSEIANLHQHLFLMLLHLKQQYLLVKLFDIH